MKPLLYFEININISEVLSIFSVLNVCILSGGMLSTEAKNKIKCEMKINHIHGVSQK